MLSLNPNRYITKGKKRASIINKKGNFQLVPLSFIDYLNSKINNDPSLVEILEYEKFIEAESFLLFNAIELNQTWETYSEIQHLSVELKNIDFLDHLIHFSNCNNCQSIDFILKSTFTQKDFEHLLHAVSVAIFARVSIQIKNDYLNNELLTKINNTNNIGEVYIELPNSYKINSESELLSKIFVKEKPANPELHCIDLTPNIDLIIESKFYHSYLNKRVHINTNGIVSRFRDDKINFGHIKSFNLQLEIENPNSFSYYWSAKKDDTDICNDCEFRYVCIDFRIPKKRKKSKWYHQIECNYNPYIAKWKGEDGYKTLKEIGVVSNSYAFSKNSRVLF